MVTESHTCQVQVATFVWGSVACGADATEQTSDRWDDVGWICPNHLKSMNREGGDEDELSQSEEEVPTDPSS